MPTTLMISQTADTARRSHSPSSVASASPMPASAPPACATTSRRSASSASRIEPKTRSSIGFVPPALGVWPAGAAMTSALRDPSVRHYTRPSRRSARIQPDILFQSAFSASICGCLSPQSLDRLLRNLLHIPLRRLRPRLRTCSYTFLAPRLVPGCRQVLRQHQRCLRALAAAPFPSATASTASTADASPILASADAAASLTSTSPSTAAAFRPTPPPHSFNTPRASQSSASASRRTPTRRPKLLCRPILIVVSTRPPHPPAPHPATASPAPPSPTRSRTLPARDPDTAPSSSAGWSPPSCM